MFEKGIAHMGVGRSSGKNKTELAAEMAIKSPLLETTIDGAKSAIISFSGDSTLGLKDINQAAKIIRSAIDPDAEIIFGATISDDLHDEVVVTVIATGLDDKNVIRPVESFESNIRTLPGLKNAVKPAEQEEIKNKAKLRSLHEDIDLDAPFEIPVFLKKGGRR